MSSGQENITYPHCGFDSAQSIYESRGEGRGLTEYCDLCGWNKYEPKDGYDSYKEDGYEEGDFPPKKDVLNIIKTIIDDIDEISEIEIETKRDYESDFYGEIILNGWVPHVYDKYGLSEFKRFWFRSIFGEHPVLRYK